MHIRVLGASGGIGDGRHTTSCLIDDDILLDAGSGVTRLSLEALARVDHVFLTHAHLDHLLSLPPMLDSVMGSRSRPVTLHAIPEVLAVLREHLFNWQLWPDFSRIPSEDAPILAYAPIEVGVPVVLGGREITALPARHVVPAVGYRLRGREGSLIFSGDTCSHAALWEAAAATADLRHLIVECSFPNSLREVAELSMHYCPETLCPDLARLGAHVAVWVTHMKPGAEVDILVELGEGAHCRLVQPLREGHIFEL